ncbi:hypothetical protein BJY01DRAFT_197373 [Aspergillus pseudoustus]|uniref:Uncharacterized protein n=1 Tax=Aspergillus pseudoustus TaxID=1810923 RepID=A0ABR4JSW6_9EURO
MLCAWDLACRTICPQGSKCLVQHPRFAVVLARATAELSPMTVLCCHFGSKFSLVGGEKVRSGRLRLGNQLLSDIRQARPWRNHIHNHSWLYDLILIPTKRDYHNAQGDESTEYRILMLQIRSLTMSADPSPPSTSRTKEMKEKFQPSWCKRSSRSRVVADLILIITSIGWCRYRMPRSMFSEPPDLG